MGQRLDLQTKLLTLCDNVYFQPPANTSMSYPCILYPFDYILTDHADNTPYKSTTRYQVTVIDEDPDSEIRDKVAALPMCAFSRYFATDNLNHYVFDIYF